MGIFSLLIAAAKTLYLWLYSTILLLVPDYGYALVALSFATILLMIPLEHSVKGIVDQETDLRSVLAPQEVAIRSKYHGAKRSDALKRLYRRYRYNPIFSVRSAYGILIQLPFLTGAYWMLSSYSPIAGVSFGPIADLSKPDALLFGLNLLPLVMTAINFVTIVLGRFHKREAIQASVLAILFLFLLYPAPSALLIYWTMNNVLHCIRALLRRLQFVKRAVRLLEDLSKDCSEKFESLLLVLAKVSPKKFVGFCVEFFQKLSKEKDALRGSAFVLGLLLLFLGIVWYPYLTYASDPEFFSGIVPRTFAFNRAALFVACALLFSLVWVILERVRTILSLGLLTLGIATLIFAFFINLDFGVIDTFILQHESPLYARTNRYMNVLVCLLAPVALVALIWTEKVRILRNIFVLGILVCFVASTQKIFLAEEILENKAPSVASSVDAASGIPDYVKQFHEFSKSGKNVVIVFLDMFTGGNMKEILEITPELRSELDGFTWYKDTVTAGTSTIFSKQAILGGDAATVLNLNKDRNHSLEVKINKAWSQFFNKLVDEKFRIRVSEDVWVAPKLLQDFMKSPEKHIFYTSPLSGESTFFWQRRMKVTPTSSEINYDRFWAAIGLFNLSPTTMKKRIYREGRWLGAVDSGDASTRHARTWLAELDTHADFSNVVNDGENRFIFVSSLITHVPWALDDKCLPCRNGGWNESRNLANAGLSQEHLRTERCSLLSVVRWIKWMKENKVYDNTQLIIVSDHGRGDSSELIAANDGKFYPLNHHGLLLVKNFGERGALRINEKARMTNVDVPEIVLRGVRNEGSEGAPWMNPNRIRLHVTGPWSRTSHPESYFSNVTLWKIEDSIYDIKKIKRLGKFP